MKHTFKINFFGWLICLSMTFWFTSCQEPNEQLTETSSLQEDVNYKVTSLKELPEIQPIINNIKRLSKRSTVLAKGETYLGVDSVLVDKVIHIIKDGYSTYTFGIDTDFENSKYIENLHLIESYDGYVAYILRYTPPNGWDEDNTNKTPEGELVIDVFDFEGHVTKYSLDREIIWTTDPTLLGRNNWGEACSYMNVKYCSNNGSGFGGEPHVAGPNCTGYPKGHFTYRLELVCRTVDFIEAFIMGGTGGGPGDGFIYNTEDTECMGAIGTIIIDNNITSIAEETCVPTNDLGLSNLDDIVKDIQNCINGYIPINGEDETILTPIMSAWLENEAPSEVKIAINNYLINENNCSENAQAFAIAAMEALNGDGVNDLNYSFDELLYNRTSLDTGQTEINDYIEGGYDNNTYELFNPQDIWESINPVISSSNFIGWGHSGIERNCIEYAKAQIAVSGYQISSYYSSGQTFQIYTEQNGVNDSATLDGLSYIKYALSNSIPVIVGVDVTPGSPNPQTDNSTDHFIVIVGMGNNLNGNYLRFYDNASGLSDLGTNANNLLYYNTQSHTISGTSSANSFAPGNTYTITMIRKSKPL